MNLTLCHLLRPYTNSEKYKYKTRVLNNSYSYVRMNKLSISSCLSNTTVSEYKSVVHIKGAVLAFSMYLNHENIQKLLMGLDIQKHAVN